MNLKELVFSLLNDYTALTEYELLEKAKPTYGSGLTKRRITNVVDELLSEGIIYIEIDNLIIRYRKMR